MKTHYFSEFLSGNTNVVYYTLVLVSVPRSVIISVYGLLILLTQALKCDSQWTEQRLIIFVGNISQKQTGL
jgi:hypothetical protein